MSPQQHAVGLRRTRAHGLATLATLLLLLLSALLAAAWAQRSALNEIRSAGNQLHAASAHQAAEAGLEWTQAMLSSNHGVGTDCQPGKAADASTFRNRFLLPTDAAGHVSPRATGPAGSPPLKIACAREPQGWSCSCPADGSPTLPIRGDADVPMFLAELAAGSRPGSVDVHAIGCSHLARPCLADAPQRADAVARLRVTLALLPALAEAPAASLTTLGSIDAGNAALGLHNADAASLGLAGHAGGSINGSALRISSTPGASVHGASVAGDPALATLTAEQLFSRHFAVEPVQWRYQPGVHRLPCRGDCSAGLPALLEANAGVARIAVEGDLLLDQGQQIGSRERPVVLVIDGDLLIRGPVRIHGLVFARNMRWDDVAVDGGGLLLGAALLSGGYAGNGAADLVYDPLLILRLKRQSGSWVRIPGSWRDG